MLSHTENDLGRFVQTGGEEKMCNVTIVLREYLEDSELWAADVCLVELHLKEQQSDTVLHLLVKLGNKVDPGPDKHDVPDYYIKLKTWCRTTLKYY